MINFDYSNAFVNSGKNLRRGAVLIADFRRMQPLAKQRQPRVVRRIPTQDRASIFDS